MLIKMKRKKTEVINKKRTVKEQLDDLAKSNDPQVRRRVNEVNKIVRESEERMAKLQKKQRKIQKEEERITKSKKKKPKRIIAKVGMKVDVFSPDKKKHLGKGVIVKVDELIVEETGEVLSKNYPTIRLENGKKIGGIKCWWSPI